MFRSEITNAGRRAPATRPCATDRAAEGRGRAACAARGPCRPPGTRAAYARRGVASVFAMLYLLIFSALAVGFYGAVTMAVQVAHNDERSLGAQVAAESGMEFMRYQLGRVKFQSDINPDEIFREVVDDLKLATLNSPNLGGREPYVDPDRRIIYFPGRDGYMIPLGTNGERFRATVQDIGNRKVEVMKPDGSPFVPKRYRTFRVFKVKVAGRHKGDKIVRAIEMEYFADYKTLSVFDFGVATRGPIVIKGTGGVFGPNSLDGSVLSTWDGATAVQVGGTATVAGQIYVVDPDTNVTISSGSSVAGTTDERQKRDAVVRGVDEPEFPIVNSEPFRKFATNPYVPNQSVYRNVVVPSGGTKTFTSDTVIEGVMYVKHPVSLKFSGKVVVRGIIIVENGAETGPQNTIEFGGGIDAYGLESLPNNSDFPEEMKKLRGSVLLAPNHYVKFTGGSGTIGGTMLADGFSMSGTAGGVIKGNLIGVGKSGFDLGGSGRIERTRTDEVPQGVIMTFTLQPQYGSYLEVAPD